MRYNPLCVITCVIQATLATSLVAAGLDNDADFKITASDGGSQDEFGTSVAVSGDVAIVGAPNEDTNGSNAGAAYIYRFNGSTWTQEDKLIADDGDASDEFGISVSIDGDIAMVGATGDDDNGAAAGAVYVFSYDGSGWNQISKLKASDGTSNDEFGISVAVSGTFAIIGASLDDDLGTNSGSAYAFRQSGTVWVQQSKITPSDGEADDRFGMAVALHDGVAVIGSRWHDGNGLNSGAAYVYANIGSNWVEEAKLEASDGNVSDQFGWSVAIDGDRILVGSRYDDDNGSASGSAYMYYFNGKTWYEYLKLLPVDGSSTDYFGNAVAISGNMAIVGASGTDDPTNAGKAYVFITFNDGDTWLERKRINAGDAAINDALGTSVAFDGSTVIAGAPFNDDDGSNSGAAYLAWPFMSDCNNNAIPDGIDISTGYSEDCNENGSPDECDTSDGTSSDCNNNDIPDECESFEDCNENNIPDECDIANGTSYDADENGVPDECQEDCNGNGLPDYWEIKIGAAEDCNNNDIPDECDIADGTSEDCNSNGVPDDCESFEDCNENNIPDDCESFEDCNENNIPDECDIADGTSADIDTDGFPDECEEDCNGNGLPDHWEIKIGAAEDCNNNDIPDECDIADGTSEDCNINTIPDDCELVDNDCNENGIPDECDIASQFSEDENFNGIPDECEEEPSCDGDADGDGEVNVVDLLAVIGEWGSTDSDADLNGDGVVNVNDLLMVVGNWGFCD